MIIIEGFWSSLMIELVGSVIIAITGWIFKKLSLNIDKKDPRKTTLFFIFIWLIWLIVNIFLLFVITFDHNYKAIRIIGFVFSALIIFLFTFINLNPFWKVGIRGADIKIEKGVDYPTALNYIQKSFSFLGVGASKLTSIPEFSKALRRCDNNLPIRLLLCEPNNKILIDASKRAGKPEDEYESNVKGSLKRIAQLHENGYPNIEVRFYTKTIEDKPIFRLFIIDDSICLVSFYVFGENLAAKLPQLHIVKEKEGSGYSTSFYHPFITYFNWLWDNSTEWNFKDFISEE